MRSMTGFGSGEAMLGASRLCVEVRSVNHRYLDVRARLPRELSEHAVFVEQCVRARLSRGRVDVGVRLDGAHPLTLDADRAREALRALQQMADELGYQDRVPLSVLGTIPELFVGAPVPAPEAAREALQIALGHAFVALDHCRAVEGASLREAMEALRRALEEALEVAAASSEGMSARLRARIAARLRASLGDLPVDGSRLAQEVVLWSERSDVTEELTRLRAHVLALRAMLGDGGAIGRRLDFLLQEIAREANTLGAKATEAPVTAAVVALKTEIERMREQAQNVE